MSDLEQARSHFEAGEFSRAREVALNGLATTPDDVDLLSSLGQLLLEQGRFREAEDALHAVLKGQADAVLDPITALRYE